MAKAFFIMGLLLMFTNGWQVAFIVIEGFNWWRFGFIIANILWMLIDFKCAGVKLNG